MTTTYNNNNMYMYMLYMQTSERHARVSARADNVSIGRCEVNVINFNSFDSYSDIFDLVVRVSLISRSLFCLLPYTVTHMQLNILYNIRVTAAPYTPGAIP